MNFQDDLRQNKQATRVPQWKKRPKAAPTGPSNVSPGYRWFKCETHSWPSLGKPEKQSVGVDVNGFKFHDAPTRWELVPKELEVLSCLQLYRRFRLEARWWRTPMVWTRNPEKEGSPIYGPYDIILVLYGQNFHITIERYGSEIFGPHPCRLFYRSFQRPEEQTWVAIAQIHAMWHSDERLLKALNHEIKNRGFWQSDKTASTIVLK